jgi:GNAT superfamily N-acetyltransferase
MQVRRLIPGDDTVRAGQLVQAAYFALDDYPHEDAYDAMLAAVAERADGVAVAVDDDGSIVGCLTLVTDTTSEHSEFDDPDATEFRFFGVDPATQGRGVGEALVQWVIDETRRLGRKRIRIHTLVPMTAAQRLYARMGFVRDPALDENWDGIIGLAYVLHLDRPPSFPGFKSVV